MATDTPTANPPMTDAPKTPGPVPLDTCLSGYGISCGLAVHLTDDCSIVVGSGTVLTKEGWVLHVAEKRFRYYVIPDAKTPDRYELAEKLTDSKKEDSLKNQFRKDTPERNFLDDKIVVLELDDQRQASFWLRSRTALVLEDQLDKTLQQLSQPENPSRSWGIFARHKPTVHYDLADIEKVLRPVLQLPDVVLPRFGYKTLAYIDQNLRNDFDDPTTKLVRLDNLRNPFFAVSGYESVFWEYKAILDDSIPELARALETLHRLFGPLLTHKSPDNLKKFRQVLLHKWQVFLEEGRHLFYIQCYYDWLSDLLKAYDELRQALCAFDAECRCAQPEKPDYTARQIRLGPVLGGQTTYKPLIFRDYFHQPFTTDHNEKRLLEIKCLHWRLMTMIWTFDLPFLRLEKNVLIDEGYLVPAEEFKDSSDYWERAFNTPDHKATFADLPIQFTPGRLPYEPLGGQAIPYYFPLDTDSPYSVHRYWDFAATYNNRIDRHHSYNASRDADSYTDQPEIRFPLLYHLREWPYFRVEGHLGKSLTRQVPTDNNTFSDVFITDDYYEVIQKYNLGLEVIAIDVDDAVSPNEINGVFPLSTLTKTGPATAQTNAKTIGLEHQPGLCAGQTWVLLFTSKGANIDLSECKKKEGTLEIAPNTVVADFILPYRFSCCHQPRVFNQ